MRVVVALWCCCWLLLAVLSVVLWVQVATSYLVPLVVAELVGIRSWTLRWMPVLVLESLVAAVLSVAVRRRSWCF